MSKVGILGGSFNPVHLGHLVMAEQLSECACLEEVLFIPALVPPHKDQWELAPPEHRLTMLRLAIGGNPKFSISEIELKRQAPSYSIDTVRELLSSRPNDFFYFLIGADTLHELPTWKEARELVRLCQFIIASRPGYDVGELRWLSRFFAKDVIESLRRNFYHTSLIGISSSDIRRRVNEGLSITYLVPPAVEDYIHRHFLYRSR